MSDNPFFSICIPAYNRAAFLPSLLDSILAQERSSYEVLIAEDCSPERIKINEIASIYMDSLNLRLLLNQENLGYDKNLQHLISESTGQYILFIGNDDLLAPNALRSAQEQLIANPSALAATRAYSVFSKTPANILYSVHYYQNSGILTGNSKYTHGIRLFGVLSGLIFNAKHVRQACSSLHDGSLYYQIYLAAYCAKRGDILYINQVLTYSRANIDPDFGQNEIEKSYTPGRYTELARLSMLAGIVNILRSEFNGQFKSIYRGIMSSYAWHIPIYLTDQSHLSPKRYFLLYRKIGSLGFQRFPQFHLLAWLTYILRPSGISILTYVYRRIRSYT